MRSFALITGASSGLGAAFARRLVSEYDLLLVARREERLRQLAGELELEGNGRRVEILVADLTQPEGLATVEQKLRAEKQRVDLLINNAGFAMAGGFTAGELARQLEMIQLHVVATLRLCRMVVPQMQQRQRGAIINVSSVNAFSTNPYAAVYGATKAFLKNFSESLHLETRRAGVRVQVLCPGFMRTEFHSQLEEFQPSRVPAGLWMSADAVVDCSLRALKQNRRICIPGIRNRLLVCAADKPWLVHLLLRFWA